MSWSTDFSIETVQADFCCDACLLEVHALELKLIHAVEAYATNRRLWRYAPHPSWRGSREESYGIAIGYALLYQRAVLIASGVEQAKQVLSSPRGWRPLALARSAQLSHIPEDEWKRAVDSVCCDARLQFGAELRAAEPFPREEA